MTAESAQKAITTSAVVVGMVYAYRKLVEPSAQTGAHLATKGAAKQLVGSGPPPPLAHWLVAYGFAFLVMSMIAQADPNMGGMFAILTAVGTVLAQGQQLAADVNGQIGTPTSSQSAGKPYSIGVDNSTFTVTPSPTTVPEVTTIPGFGTVTATTAAGRR